MIAPLLPVYIIPKTMDLDNKTVLSLPCRSLLMPGEICAVGKEVKNEKANLTVYCANILVML